MQRKPAQIPIRLTAVRVRQLQLFALAAQVGSISEAARRSHVTQPTATEMLQELERAFSLQLFIRSSKGIVLTEQGQRVAARATSALRELEWAVSEAASAAPVREVLRVGFVPPAMYGQLPSAIECFVDSHADVQLNLREFNGPDSVLALMEGEIDIALTMHHPSFTHVEGRERIELQTLAAQNSVVYLSSKMILPARWAPTPDALRELPWILPLKESVMRSVFEDWFFRHAVEPPQSVVEISPMTAAIELLRVMPYAALLPDTLSPKGNFAHLVPLPHDALNLPSSLVAASKETQAARPSVRAFIDALK